MIIFSRSSSAIVFYYNLNFLLRLPSVMIATSSSVPHRDAWEISHVHGFQHIHRIPINFNRRRLQSRFIRYEIHSAFSFLFLKFQRNSSHRSSLNSLHQVRRETGDFVSQSLRGNDCDFICDSLIRRKIESETRVILLDDLARRLLLW